jgi:hypothetical protein
MNLFHVFHSTGGQISEWNRKDTTVYTACKQCGNRCIALAGVAAATPEEKEQERVDNMHATPSWMATAEEKARALRSATTGAMTFGTRGEGNGDEDDNDEDDDDDEEEEEERLHPRHHLWVYQRDQAQKLRGCVDHDQLGICDRCQQYATCVVCERPVRGPLVWRSKCGHGGHLDCMEMWRKAVVGEAGKRRRKVVIGCPAGCDI